MKKNKRNAVLYKEMTVDIKKPKAILIIILVNLLLFPVMGCFFLGIAVAGLKSMVSYRVMTWYFIAMVGIEFAIISFLTPAVTSGTVSLEKERQTLDVLLTTRMTPWEIIKGKYSSVMVLLGLIIVSTLPLLSIVFIYGGTSLIGVIIIILALIVYAGMVAAFGVFYSSLTKNTVLAVILSYVSLFMYMAITVIVPIAIILVIESINDWIYMNTGTMSEHLLYSDIFALLGVANPATIIFDLIGKFSGLAIPSSYFSDETNLSGMNYVLGEILPHFTEKNILLKLWSVWGIIHEVLLSFILLRLSARCINPVKKKSRKVKKANNTGNRKA